MQKVLIPEEDVGQQKPLHSYGGITTWKKWPFTYSVT